jgi:hypothetical protein
MEEPKIVKAFPRCAAIILHELQQGTNPMVPYLYTKHKIIKKEEIDRGPRGA